MAGVFELCCCVRMRVGIEGREKARGAERGGAEEEEGRQTPPSKTLSFCSELRQLVQYELQKYQKVRGVRFLIKRCGICHTQTITMDSPSFVLLNCWPVSLSAETLCVFPLSNLLTNLISILKYVKLPCLLSSLSSPFFHRQFLISLSSLRVTHAGRYCPGARM